MKRRTMLARTLLAAGALMEARAEAPVPGTPGSARDIALPAPRGTGAQALEQALEHRRSVRSYIAQPIALADVAQLLWAAQGITAPEGRRTAPSAGALYPLELHLVATRVEGLPPGTYRYLPAAHALRLGRPERVADALAHAAYTQQALRDAAAVVVIAAVPARTAAKYGARAERYISFEAGAASQNLALQSAVLGLGTVVIGAFDDDAVARVLDLGPRERALALMPVGRRV